MDVAASREAWAEWEPALLRLDRRIEAAIASIDEVRKPAEGEATGLERLAGIYLDPEEMRRLARRPPGRYGSVPDWHGEVGGPEPEPLTNELPPGGRGATLERLAGLTPFETDVVLMALAPEIDPKYEKLYAFLNDDVTRRRPTVGLALALLCGDPAVRLARRIAFGPGGALTRLGLIELGTDEGASQAALPGRALRLDEGVVRFLAGVSEFDPRLAVVAPDESTDSGPEAFDAQRLAAAAAAVNRTRDTREPIRLVVSGPAGAGKTTLARRLARLMRRPRLAVDLARLASLPAGPAVELSHLIVREALLRKAVLHLVASDPSLGVAAVGGRIGQMPSGREGEVAAPIWPGLAALRELRDGLRETSRRIVVVIEATARGAAAGRLARAAGAAGYAVVGLETPHADDRRAAWSSALEARGLGDTIAPDELNRLADTFGLAYGPIHSAARQAAIEGGGSESIWNAARAQAVGSLDDLAEPIEPHAGWTDLVVTPAVRSQLDDLVRRVRLRDRVLDDWGFGDRLGHGKGTNALFAGPPGTGKTLAAEVLAAKLGLPLFRIDCSSVVSKYIGETEKNLERVFQAADDSDAVLFFDEADALYGKRTEVHDAHDRYANLETAYLLQRIERHDGLVILASNLLANMDQAFVRRLACVVMFSLPDEARRREIWERIWPGRLPLGDDLDFAELAALYPVSGGTIKNCALAASYLAADDETEPDPDQRRVCRRHVVAAMAQEYRNIGKPAPGLLSASRPVAEARS